MPTLACRVCGRVVYTTVSIDALFAEERRCPRCGSILFGERRVDNRRKVERRRNPADDPGPPGNFDRRVSDRRSRERRRSDDKTF
jgi:hypothetical protein